MVTIERYFGDLSFEEKELLNTQIGLRVGFFQEIIKRVKSEDLPSVSKYIVNEDPIFSSDFVNYVKSSQKIGRYIPKFKEKNDENIVLDSLKIGGTNTLLHVLMSKPKDSTIPDSYFDFFSKIYATVDFFMEESDILSNLKKETKNNIHSFALFWGVGVMAQAEFYSKNLIKTNGSPIPEILLKPEGFSFNFGADYSRTYIGYKKGFFRKDLAFLLTNGNSDLIPSLNEFSNIENLDITYSDLVNFANSYLGFKNEGFLYSTQKRDRFKTSNRLYIGKVETELLPNFGEMYDFGKKIGLEDLLDINLDGGF